MTKQTYRRRTGLILGVLIGLVVGLASQTLNPLLLPGIPLFNPPLGMWGNLLLITSVGAVLGLLSAWMESSVAGVAAAAAAGAVLLLSTAFFTGRALMMALPAKTIGFVFLWLPFAALLIPVFWLVRSAINHLTDYRSVPQSILSRWWRPVLVIAAAGVVGWLTIYPPAARMVLVRNHQMLQQALTAASDAQLPKALTGPEMTDFNSRASGTYTLDWENKNLSIYAIPRPSGPEYLMSVSIARFDNGWNVVCLYPTTESEPRCRSFDELP